MVIWRIPRGESVSRPRSYCPNCKAQIRSFDNIPVLSWLLLGGKCRKCKTQISIRYPLVEISCAGLFLLAGLHFRQGYFELAIACTMSATLLAVSVIDIEHYIIPNKIVLFATLVVVGTVVGHCIFISRWIDLRNCLVGGGISFLLFALIHFGFPSGMGFGDVKLALLIGLSLAAIRLAFFPIGLFLAFLAGSIFGLGSMAIGKATRKSKIPFGPFLSIGALATLYVGPELAKIWLGR